MPVASTSLDTSTSTPLYVQMADELMSQIKSGQLAPGSRLPTEMELSSSYGVSRVTVRKALSLLSERNLLERTSGKGTFVSCHIIQRPLSGVINFSANCKMQGLVPGARTIRRELVDPTDEEREAMQIPADEKILVIERIRSADGTPVTIETTKFSESCLFLIDEDLENNSLYVILEKHGIVFNSSVKSLEITLADYETSLYLKIPKGHPLLDINSVVSDTLGGNISLSRQLVVTDRYKLYV